LELGNHIEANMELEKIAPQSQAHPDVVEVRWHIYAAAKEWEAALDIAATLIQLDPDGPLGWVHRSYAVANKPKSLGNPSDMPRSVRGKHGGIGV
jgi:hypothetical protein